MLFLPPADAVVQAPAAKWFGPVHVRFAVEFAGNPYDPEQNDVKVRFVGPGGLVFERLAWYDGDGGWRAVLVTPNQGLYKAELWRNGKVTAGEPEVEDGKSTEINAEKPLARGFLRTKGDRFFWDDGGGYFPLGYNLAWQSPGLPDMTEQLAIMGKNGVDWTRIWANHWDGKNPWWISDEKAEKPGPGWLADGPLKRWDALVEACDKNGVSFQMVLFHHGQFSSTVNSNWGDNPWNAKNPGGFLKDPADFFTDPEAKRRSKLWLRTAVARYAHSPRLMAWELWNEVEWVDAYKAGRFDDVKKWHTEMAQYLRSIDPYRHLVTSSSALEHREIFESMDYLQPHTYPVDVRTVISGASYGERPGFFGEFGPGGRAEGAELKKVVRDGIWAGLLSGQAGAGQYWYWDIVEKEAIHDDFRFSRAAMDDANLPIHPVARPISVAADTLERGPAVIRPGADWAPQTTGEIDLLHPTPEQLRGWSAYFQSSTSANAAMGRPLTIRFNAPRAGKLVLKIAAISKGGARLHLKVKDGGEAIFDSAPAAEERTDAPDLVVDYPAGPVEVTLTNDGGDWARLASISADGLAPVRRAQGLGESRWALVRVDGGDAKEVSLSGLGLLDNTYPLSITDLLT
ncbi:hypothetical protein EON79_10930, partial [bacterium]